MKIKYSYKIISLRDNSHKYGNCRVCGKHANEMFHQIEKKKIKNGWTFHGCFDSWGHYNCVISKQR